MFQKPQLQEQLENIEEAANTYFDVDDPSSADEKRRAEIDQDLASFVNRMFDVIEPSSRFGESDEATLRNELSRTQVALRFRRLRRWNTFVEHDEGTVLAVVPAGQAEDPIFSVSHAREEFDEGLGVIGRFLIRIPDQPQGEIEEASSKQQMEKEVAIFPSPPGLRWKDTTIAFISDYKIRVEAKGLAEQYVYDEIGFEDKRAGGKGKLWDVLRALAMLKGSATVDDLENASKDRINVSKDISRLRKILFKLMGIKGDPFCGYKERECYETKFTLRDEQTFGEHRKPEADGEELLQEVYSEELSPKWLKS